MPSNAADARVPWTSSRVHGSPEPPKPFIAAPAFSQLTFTSALEMTAADGRFYVVENLGKIFSFPTRQDVAPADVQLVIDLKALHPALDHAYGIAFHPQWKQNRQIFLTYTVGSGIDDGTKLSRFRLTDAQPPQIDPASEEVLLTWRSGGHNGACLQFGPDGFLYISTGDSEVPSPPDPLNTGQDNRDLLSCILRIDVNAKGEGRPYRVPPDNPYVNKPDVRPEIWAFGFRNPWKFSFDPANGSLWCGDVGWELWEMVHLVRKGGNYGWSAMEASQPVKPELKSKLAPITPPVVAHSHDEAASMTGGFVYHGRQFPELEGACIYGDWETGKVWALWHDGEKVVRHEEIADTPQKIVSFGRDEAGELYYIHWDTVATLHRLVRNPDAGKAPSFPRRLSETGLFADVAKQQPAPGVYAYDVATPRWHDGATGRRFVALPGSSTIQTLVQQKGSGPPSFKTTAPADTVLVKTLFAKDAAGAEKPVETQMTHFNGESWNAYSYAWNEQGTDAELVPASGAERKLRMQSANGETHDYHWRYASRAECLRCHNMWIGFRAGFQPEQLAVADQLERLTALGLIEKPFAESNTLRLASTSDAASSSVESRARSYLHANCAHCHRQNGGGAVTFFINAELQMQATNALDVVPAQGGLGLKAPKLIDPGRPWNSAVCVRLAKTGSGHMPVVGPHEVDVEGLKLVEDWITSLAPDRATREAAWDESSIKESLAGVEGAMRVRRALDDQRLDAPLRDLALRTAWASPEATIRDLFDRFKPDDQREQTLGLNVDPVRLLAMQGDADRGASVLSVQGKLSACFGCHLIRGIGRDFGPDLSRVGGRLAREQLLDSVLHPSATIAPEYRAVVVQTSDGQMLTGFVSARGKDKLTLKLPGAQVTVLDVTKVQSEKPLPVSLMPEGQWQGLTAQEAADVLAFLSALR